MKNLKEYDSTPNLTPVSSTTSVASLDIESLVSVNTLNEIINQIYEDNPYIKYKRSHSFDTFHIRKIPLSQQFINKKTFIVRSDTYPF